MKKTVFRKITEVMTGTILAVGMLSGCGQSNEPGMESSATGMEAENSNLESQGMNASTDQTAGADNTENTRNTEIATDSPDSRNQKTAARDLEVRFGDNGEPFMMHLYNNYTAEAIAGYVGTSDWRLPLYERDDVVDYSVLQYYDIPGRYEIPSNPVIVTSQKAGEVYYSDPNRIVLFYHDAKVEGEYTLIGYFDVTEEFTAAVEENPVLEGWGNKILQIAQP